MLRMVSLQAAGFAARQSPGWKGWWVQRTNPPYKTETQSRKASVNVESARV